MTKITVDRDCTIELKGYSDDTFICEGPGVDLDDDDSARGTTRSVTVFAPDGSGVIVHGTHGDYGWMIGLAPLDEDRRFEGTIVVEQGRGRESRPYSPPHTMVVRINVVSGTALWMERVR
jgi:hypothetical protein